MRNYKPVGTHLSAQSMYGLIISVRNKSRQVHKHRGREIPKKSRRFKSLRLKSTVGKYWFFYAKALQANHLSSASSRPVPAL